MRFEADTKKELKKIQDSFIREILKIDSKLEIQHGKE
jgi:hypothetical protein